jgi:hypothetical protein
MRYRLPDASHSKDPQHLPRQLPAHERERRTVWPLARAEEPLRLVSLARRAEKEQDRRVGYGVGENAGRVSHGDVPASRRLPVAWGPGATSWGGAAVVGVAEIRFSQWTTAGRLRHPTFEGLRDDKSAHDVVREEPV